MCDREYLIDLARRIREGTAPHMETLMAHYAWGKPKDRIEVTGFDITALEVLLVEARNGTNGTALPVNGNGVHEIELDPTKDD
jgi:hypothetical protein